MENDQPIGLAELQKLEFEMLVLAARICEENRLRYYLAYGTLLGAVRHQGFIPWDDDIDIIMPRPDYVRLIEIIAQGDYGDFKILSLQNEKDYFYPFAKLSYTRTVLYEDFNQQQEVELGVNIDIFPLDGLPDSLVRSNLIFRINRVLRFLEAISNQKFPPSGKTWCLRGAKMIVALLLKPIGYKGLLRWIDVLASRYDYDCSKYIACIVWADGKKERILKDCIEGSEKLSFEGELFPVPSDYDRFLSNIYGDYMQFPPEKERIPKHRWRAYWKRIS